MRSSNRADSRYPDAVFECLADSNRRNVVEVLREQGASSLDELAAAVAEFDGRSSSHTGRLELSLHHTHLPKLDDAGLVEYDSDREIIEPTERTAAAGIVVQTVEQCNALSPYAEAAGSERARLE